MTTLARLMGDDPNAIAEVTTLRVLVNQRLSLLQTLQLMAPVTDLTNHGQLIRELNQGKDAMDEIRTLVDRQEAQAADLLARRQRNLDASRHVAFLVGVVGMPLGVLASLLVVMLFVQRLARRICAQGCCWCSSILQSVAFPANPMDPFLQTSIPTPCMMYGGYYRVVIMRPVRLLSHFLLFSALMLSLITRLGAQTPIGKEFFVTLPTTPERNDTSFKFRLEVYCSRETKVTVQLPGNTDGVYLLHDAIVQPGGRIVVQQPMFQMFQILQSMDRPSTIRST